MTLTDWLDIDEYIFTAKEILKIYPIYLIKYNAMRIVFLALIVTSFCSIYIDAFAAPFCINAAQQDQRCLYHDIRQCENVASQGRGYCTLNPAHKNFLVRGQQDFCITGSGAALDCFYDNHADCSHKARIERKYCVSLKPATSLKEAQELQKRNQNVLFGKNPQLLSPLNPGLAPAYNPLFRNDLNFHLND